MKAVSCDANGLSQVRSDGARSTQQKFMHLIANIAPRRVLKVIGHLFGVLSKVVQLAATRPKFICIAVICSSDGAKFKRNAKSCGMHMPFTPCAITYFLTLNDGVQRAALNAWVVKASAL